MSAPSTTLNFSASLFKILTFVVWKANGERRGGNFPLEEILLVEEENDGRLHKPLVIADRLEELHRLMHSILEEIPALGSNKGAYHFLVFRQNEIVSRERDAENYRRDAFKTVDPLLSLRSLSAYIVHPRLYWCLAI